jgi:NAD(P)-dependent dehydrogenase (short-subunit alcohol dehydrogenase family)
VLPGARGRQGGGTAIDSEFTGRGVVVFGAAGALGHGLAAAFQAAGADVTGADRTEPSGARRLDGVAYHALDVRDEMALAAVLTRAAPWAVVNTVGGFAGHRPLAELDMTELTHQMGLNLMTAALVTKHALAVMQPAGTGRIVHTASRAAIVTKGSGFAYSVSKAAVLHLVAMAADEVRGTGVTVNCVVPSIIDTPANRAAMPRARHAEWPKIPDIACTYLYLASPRAALVNGAAVPV